jgi:hypothetical protein
MIVGVLVICLDDIVINVLNGKFGPYPIQSQGFECQHGHGSRGVLQEYLVDSDADLFSGGQFSFNQMGFEYLVGQILRHRFLLCFLAQYFL